MLNKKRMTLCFVSLVSVIAVICSVLLFSEVNTNAEEYNELNPTFSEARINSDVELSYAEKTAYEQETEFFQNSTAGKYEIETNAYVMWYKTDDVAFLYRKYNIGSTASDKLTVQVTVDKQESVKTSGLYSTASSGLVMRGSIGNGAAAGAPSVYVHTRSTGVDVVYRSAQGESTIHSPSGVKPDYPVTLRIEKVGKKYTCMFKDKNMSDFKKICTVGADIKGPLYAGLASHSSQSTNPIHSYYSDYSAVGSGECDDVGDDSPSSSGPEKIDVEDPPIDENILLFETFTDGSMTDLTSTDGKETVTNPLWNRPFGELQTNSDKTNRYWYTAFDDGYMYAGNKDWTDYSATFDFKLEDGISTDGSDRLAFWVRRNHVAPTGYYGIAASIETEVTASDEPGKRTVTPRLAIYRHFRSAPNAFDKDNIVRSVGIPQMIGTGWHTIKIVCLDNKFTFYIDDWENPIAEYTDNTTSPATRGYIGIAAESVEASVDNITVTKIDDPIGGDYDNYIGGNYDEEIPQFVLDYWNKTEKKY